MDSTMSTTTEAPKPRRALPPLMSLSDAAAERLRALYAKGEGKMLRVSVSTKGCSGMSYQMDWVDSYLHYLPSHLYQSLHRITVVSPLRASQTEEQDIGVARG